MSVTFWTPGAPYSKVQLISDDPDSWMDVPDEGFYELNMSNTNASAMLRFLCREEDARAYCGSWDIETCKGLLEMVKEKLSDPNKQAELKSPDCREGNMVYFGRDMDYVHSRLTTLKNLLESAITHNMEVSFG